MRKYVQRSLVAKVDAHAYLFSDEIAVYKRSNYMNNNVLNIVDEFLYIYLHALRD